MSRKLHVLFIILSGALFLSCSDKKPAVNKTAAPVEAKRLYEFFVGEARKQIGKVETGKFQAMMKVELINDGPVTILLDSEKLF